MKIVNIGIIKLRRELLTLIMILILSPQLTYSQTVNIDLINEQTVLDKEATIDKAKFVENEKKLRVDNLNLLEIIRKQDSTISSITKENISALETIQDQNNRIFDLSKDISRLSEYRQEITEEKTKQSSLYIVGGLDYIQKNEQYNPNIGLAFLPGKIGFGVNTGLISGDIYLGGKIYINIF